MIPLLLEELDTAPIIGPALGLGEARKPLIKLVGKKQLPRQVGLIGDGCTLCHRHKEREGDGVQKPRMYRGSDPSAQRVMLVFSYNTYGVTVDRIVEYVRTFHAGHILVDLPVRCGDGQATDKQIESCRPYLSKSYQEFKPDRVICFGGRASSSVLGKAVPASKNRWCWTTLPGQQEEGPRVPVVIVMDPTVMARSRMHAAIIEREVRWAITEPNFVDMRPTGHALILESEDDLLLVRQWVAEAKRRDGWISMDVETDGVMFNPGFSVIACSLSSFSLPDTLTWDTAALKVPALREALKEILLDPELPKRGSNVKYDTLSIMCEFDIVMAPIDGDCRLEMKQANPDSSAKLDDMEFYVGINTHKKEAREYIKKAKKIAALEVPDDVDGVSPMAFAFKHLPPDVMLRYNGGDSWGAAKICKYARTTLGELEGTLNRLILPANEMYTAVEATGMALDLESVEFARVFLEGEIARLAPVFEKNEVDPDNPHSIREWLVRMDIESPLLTKKTQLPSTSAKALGLIKHKNSVIATLIEHRKLAKLLQSYATTLPRYVRGDGRVHPTFLLDGTRSGRASCKNPALQTIPSRDAADGPKLSKMIKNCFVARKGYKLVCADFSILEIRVAAMLSQDPAMLVAAQTDFHTETAKSLAQLAWGMTPEAVEAEIRGGKRAKRDVSKTLGFAIVYGAGPDTVAERIGVAVREASKLIEGFRGLYSTLGKWAKEIVRFARKHGMIEVPWLDGSLGRIRPLLDIVSADGEARGNAERAAVNDPIQALASDICMASAIEIFRELIRRNLPANIVCLVHDSIIVEVREDFLREIIAVMRRCMTTWPTRGVPLQVDVEYGDSWGNMVKDK